MNWMHIQIRDDIPFILPYARNPGRFTKLVNERNLSLYVEHKPLSSLVSTRNPLQEISRKHIVEHSIVEIFASFKNTSAGLLWLYNGVFTNSPAVHSFPEEMGLFIIQRVAIRGMPVVANFRVIFN